MRDELKSLGGLLVLSLICIVASCNPQRSYVFIEPERDSNSRISFVEVKSKPGIAIYIVEVDGNEFILSSEGGIEPLPK